MKYTGLFLLTFFISFQAFSIKITDLSAINGNELQITEIELDNKGLTKFPVKILDCKNLQKLSIRKNGFVKIPIQLGELEHLKKLDLSENQNLSPLDLENLFDNCVFQLEELNISDCALFYLPEAIKNQTAIVNLDISFNYIQVLPYGMMFMTKLEKADFSNNRLKNISWLSTQWWSLKDLDVSGNKELEGEGLLLNLSFQDNIEKLTISYLDMIPEEFKYFKGKEVVFENSIIAEIPREKYSNGLNRITFVDCAFPNPTKIIETLNEQVKPDRISFRNIDGRQLMPFLELNVDSLDLKGNQLSNIDPIAKMEKVKWIDVRSNKVTKNSLDFIKKERPDIALYSSEPINESRGISPPLPKLAPKPELVKIAVNKEQEIQIGSTIFDVPKNAFLTASGSVYEGPVSIEYTEFNTPEDIFLSGIAMTANTDGEPYMLSSGGMFNFEAKDEYGNALKANPDLPIAVNVISQNDRDDMELWRMDDDGNWEGEGLNEMLEIFKGDRNQLDSVMETDYMEMAKTQVEFITNRFSPYTKRGNKLKDFEIGFEKYYTYYGNKKVKLYGDKIVVFTRNHHSEYLAGKTLVYDGDSADYHKEFLDNLGAKCKSTYRKLRIKRSTMYNSYGPNFISELKIAPDYENDNFDLTFKYKDSLVNIPVLFKTTTDNIHSEPREITSYFQNYQNNYKKYVKEKRKNHMKLEPFLKKMSDILREKAFQAERNRIRQLNVQLLNNANMEDNGSVSRNFSMPKFGLWNCDARSRMVSPTQMASEFVNTEGEPIDDEVVNITLIDRSQNGVLQYDDPKTAFFDNNSKNVIMVFFASAGIGVFRSWIEWMNNGKMQLKMQDLENKSEEDVKHILRGEDQ